MKQLFHFIGATVLIFGLLGCKRPPSNLLHCYVEGEFVDVFVGHDPVICSDRELVKLARIA